jgi:hypothetical protein
MVTGTAGTTDVRDLDDPVALVIGGGRDQF